MKKNFIKILIVINVILYLFIIYLFSDSKEIEDYSEDYTTFQDFTVYITKNSSKYHRAGCDYLDGMPYKLTLKRAKEDGYGPCIHCEPYTRRLLNYEALWIDYETVFVLGVIAVSLTILIIGIIIYRHRKSISNRYNIPTTNLRTTNNLIFVENGMNNTQKIEEEPLIQENINQVKTIEEEIDSKKEGIHQPEQEKNIPQTSSKIQNTQQHNPSGQNVSTTNEELPMTWYIFTQYIRLPFGILTDLAFIANHYDEFSTLSILLSLTWIIFSIYLVYLMAGKREGTFKCTIIHSALVCILSSEAITFFINAIILLCNYFYFKKRKHLFIN